MLFSDSPNHMLIMSDPFIEIKLIPHSLAKAFAVSVFPQPGGPKRRMPLEDTKSKCRNSFG